MLDYSNSDEGRFWRDWQDQNSHPTLVNDESIARVERELGVKLPSAFVALLRLKNGGIPRKQARLLTPEQIEISQWRVFPLVLGSIEQLEYLEWRWGLDESDENRFLYFGWGVGPWICFDYRGCGPTGEPSVVCIWPSVDETLLELGESFEAYIRSLWIAERMDCYGIVHSGANDGLVWTEVVERLDLVPGETFVFGDGVKAKRHTFGHHKSWQAVGYVGGERRNAHFTLKPNIDSSYEVGYLDHPECAWLLRTDCTPGRRAELQAILETLSYETVIFHLVDWARFPGTIVE
jgi:hypothetical protein